MNLNREVDRFVGAIAGTKGSEHISFGSDTEAGAPSWIAFSLMLSQRFRSRALIASISGSASILSRDLVNLFKFKVDQIVHDTLGCVHVQ